MIGRSHPDCHTTAGHVCQEPSGRSCYERDCAEPAGTWWGPFWCPKHDMERLDRLAQEFASLRAGFEAKS